MGPKTPTNTGDSIVIDIAHTVPDIPELLDAIDAAEPVLWESLDSLRPLFNLIPNDAIPMDHAYRYAPPIEYYDDEEGRLREHRREFVLEDYSSTGLLSGLAACPALHDLRVYVMDTDDDDCRAVVPCQGFSALRHLYCIGTSLPFLRSVLSSRPALALSTLSADVRMRATADLHALLSTVGAHVDRGTLTHIGVSNAHWNIARAPIPLGPHALRALPGSARSRSRTRTGARPRPGRRS
ncbi:hypothetical protein EV121DRAFT_294146 [Schizophyllum commune]